ncbi:ABC transporter permease [Leifsonia poae]|uniref:ABC transporter permease n=1 Tax=Leifsonia poae TaxID=110933 RepID=UPI001CC15F83|nr:ABC transporter permease [Leifsonia poae]
MSTSPAPVTTPGFVSSVGLVAGREISTRLRSKAFLVSTGILLLVVLASVLLGGFLGGSPSEPKVAVLGTASAIVEKAGGLEQIPVDSRAEGERLVRDGEVSALIVPSESGTPAVTVIGLDKQPTDVVSALSLRPTVDLLDPAAQSPFLVYIVAIGFGMVFLFSAITFGTMIAQSVVEEKQTRIVEILMSTIPVRALLAGKVLGNSLLAFGQIVAIAVLATIGMMVTDQTVLLGTVGPSIVLFVVFFIVGFVLLAALYAATAALVSRSEDIGSVTSPVMMLVMIPYFLVIFFYDNPTVLGIMSYVPFSAPVGMPIRVFLGTAEWWEPVLSLAILVATTVLVLGLGARIYSNSLLRTGARVTLSEALKG